MINIESRYVLAKQGSKKHGWSPKLSFRFLNMTLNNAYKIYTVLKPLSMDDAIEELITHSLLQGGDGVLGSEQSILLLHNQLI